MNSCAFETDRLSVREWRRGPSNHEHQRGLAHVVAAMLTEAVTRSLPVSWQGIFTTERARAWIDERDKEGTLLIVVETLTHQIVGLVILSETQVEGRVEVRIGYLLSEDVWGKGMASELVDGFVKWCHGQTSISSIVGGVAVDNLASRRVLEKNGFTPANNEGEHVENEVFYRLSLL